MIISQEEQEARRQERITLIEAIVTLSIAAAAFIAAMIVESVAAIGVFVAFVLLGVPFLISYAGKRVERASREKSRLFHEATALARLILDVAEHGDYSNGNTGPGGYPDEGQVRASEMLQHYSEKLSELINSEKP